MRSQVTAMPAVLLLLVGGHAAAVAGEPGERWTLRAQQPGLSPLRKKAYEQLAKVHTCRFESLTGRGSICVLSFNRTSDLPMDVLHSMGLDALPIIAEALADSTPTQTVVRTRSRERTWAVNELVARLIRRLADREFVIGEWGPGVSVSDIGQHPELAQKFRSLVVSWHEENKNRSMRQRKIADLDSNLRNRLDAIRWLGRNSPKSITTILSSQIDNVLDGSEVSSSTQTELADAAEALGKTKDPRAVEPVRLVCDHLSYSVNRGWGIPENTLRKLFVAHHALAALGHKDEALDEQHRTIREKTKHIATRKLEGSTQGEMRAYIQLLEGFNKGIHPQALRNRDQRNVTPEDLRRYLKSPDDDRILACVRAVHALKGRKQIGVAEYRILKEALKHKNWRVRVAAIDLIEGTGPAPTDMIPLLLGLIQKDPIGEVRLNAVDLLWKMGAPAVPALIDCLSSKTGYVRWRSAQALRFIAPVGESAIPALIKALGDEEGHARWHAACALGNFGAKAGTARQALTGLLKDSDERVRAAAAEAIEKIPAKVE